MCASLLDEAINIKNINIEIVHIFGKLHRDEIKQFFLGDAENGLQSIICTFSAKRLEIIPIMDALKRRFKT